jgi:hypothetical protein
MIEIVSKTFKYILAMLMGSFVFSLCWGFVFITGKIVMKFFWVV